MALAAAMLIGGLAGFAARTWSLQQPAATASGAVTAAQGAGLLDRNAERVDATQSDLTRALPKATVNAPAEIPGRQFGVPQVGYVPGSEYAIPQAAIQANGGRALRAHVS
ncbi:MAG TPA: hypothetical protein VEU76_05480 [Candidatus Udaeobacter sp.]|nr:hypothetical protein [Candidatus Udaeobacter sp.]